MGPEDSIEALQLRTKELGALRRLRIRTVREFLTLNVDRVLELRGYGYRTRKMLAARQRHLRRRFLWHSCPALPVSGPPSLQEVTSSLGSRARYAIEALRVDTLAAFLQMREADVVSLRQVGRTTWQEICEVIAIARSALASWKQHCDGAGVPLQDLTRSPPSGGALLSLPFFCPGSTRTIEPGSLHPGYGASICLDKIPLPSRVQGAAYQLGISTLGGIITAPPDCFLENGVGWQTIEQAREIIAGYVLSGRAAPLGRDPLTEEALAAMPLYANLPCPGLEPRFLHESYCPGTEVGQLELSVRATNALRRLNVGTLGTLLAIQPEDLRRLPNCGEETVSGIQEKLRSYLLEKNRLLPPKQIAMESFHKMVSSYFRLVHPNRRIRLVVTQRLGIAQQPAPTLGDLSQSLGLTRERVRQLEARGLKAMGSPRSLALLKPFGDAVMPILARSGSFVQVEKLAREITAVFGWRHRPRAAPLAGFLRILPEVTVMELELGSSRSRFLAMTRDVASRRIGLSEGVSSARETGRR